ncbi:MAG: ABC transporter ATP-binding protein [Clostridia bacterium]|nr:ABC transporter ATP-binding protein [Clostridia bacterium]
MKENMILELKNITVSFDGETVLDNLNLSIRDGEFVTFLGASGCGKTTTLRVIAGFITPDSGDVFFDGGRINDLPPYKRQVNTIFQRYALFPHLNVFDNVAFGLKVAGMKKEEIRPKVEEMLELVNMKAFAHRKIHTLSGGQQQRVAIARALVNSPRILLLDEPLAALDYKLRKDMQNELRRIQRATGITFIFVTHDQEEALSMSDTVVVMNEGKIQQIGSPTDIYNEPQNAFVADFIGESNIIDGVMLEDYKVRLDGRDFECLDKGFAPKEPVDVVIRPEDVDIVPLEKGKLEGEVTAITFKGDYYEMIVDVCGFKWMVQATDETKVGTKVGLIIEPDAIHIMKKSKYSGMFGDYSTFSDEMDQMDAEEEALEQMEESDNA